MGCKSSVYKTKVLHPQHQKIDIVEDVNPIPLKERPVNNVEGGESTSNSSLEEKFIPTQDEGLNKPQLDGRRETPQRQHK